MKKIIAVVLSAFLAFTQLPVSYAYAADSEPYIENGIYYRYSEGKYIPFNTDYDEMVDYFQTQMLERKSSISYSFATSDVRYKYTYESESDGSAANKVGMKFIDDLYHNICTCNTFGMENSPALGDYLYNSIKEYSSVANVYSSSYDNKIIDGKRYYTFTIKINNIQYGTDSDQEYLIKDAAQKFTDNYILPESTEYEKVKTIYDYIVRNTTYDYDVFEGKYDQDSQRYKFSHSAFGAIYGALSSTDDYDMNSFDAVQGQKIISKADQGLAVCQGYSKLFYYLCTMNGIQCRIVDGDYTAASKKDSDPHEWNYVYLDDDNDGVRDWFQVDTTFASQNSFKKIGFNNYNYFLCGSDSQYFNEKNHQQAYAADGKMKQLYDWYSAEYISSKDDYQIFDVSYTLNNDWRDLVVAKRSSVDADGNDRITYYYVDDKDQLHDFVVNSENHIIEEKSVNGFEYNGKNDTFEFFIPYIVTSREYTVTPITAKDTGDYTVSAKSVNSSEYNWNFSIIPRDMADERDIVFRLGNSESKAHSGDLVIDTNYTGDDFLSSIQIDIKDGFGNQLVQGKDFDLKVYKDASHRTPASAIQDMGTYHLDIAYKGNYTGHYYFRFIVGKIKLSALNVNTLHFQYIPESYLKTINMNSMEEYIKSNHNLTVGDISITNNVDYSTALQGSANYGDSGYLVLTGLKDSKKCVAGDSVKVKYEISEQFDISDESHSLNDKAVTSQAYVYTGSPINPKNYNNLDKVLVKGKDYEISKITDNTNAGKAKVVVKGVNGCTGTITMYFVIQQKSIAASDVKFAYTSLNTKGGSYTLTYNGKKLVKDKDFTQTITVSKGICTIKLKGIGNFSGSRTINFNIVTPTSSGNYAKLSALSYTYDGKAKKPVVKVYNKSNQLIDSYYYTVSYSSNTDPGKAKVTITFKNGYKGTLTCYFKINPKKTSISSLTAASKAFTVKWKADKKVTGYQIQYSTTSDFKKSTTKTISKNSTTSLKVSKLTKNKKYYVRIRSYKKVGSSNYYGAWSAVKSIKTK